MKERKEEPIKNGGEERIGEEKNTSTYTCMNILSQFNFLTPMDYNPWSEGKFWLLLKATKKKPNLQKRKSHAHQNWFPCISRQPLLT